jgi:hypothetical protein
LKQSILVQLLGAFGKAFLLLLISIGLSFVAFLTLLPYCITITGSMLNLTAVAPHAGAANFLFAIPLFFISPAGRFVLLAVIIPLLGFPLLYGHFSLQYGIRSAILGFSAGKMNSLVGSLLERLSGLDLRAPKINFREKIADWPLLSRLIVRQLMKKTGAIQQILGAERPERERLTQTLANDFLQSALKPSLKPLAITLVVEAVLLGGAHYLAPKYARCAILENCGAEWPEGVATSDEGKRPSQNILTIGNSRFRVATPEGATVVETAASLSFVFGPDTRKPKTLELLKSPPNAPDIPVSTIELNDQSTLVFTTDRQKNSGSSGGEDLELRGILTFKDGQIGIKCLGQTGEWPADGNLDETWCVVLLRKLDAKAVAN